MTYAELAEEIGKMTDEQKNTNVTVRMDSEYHSVDLAIVLEDDVLDKGHPVLL